MSHMLHINYMIHILYVRVLIPTERESTEQKWFIAISISRGWNKKSKLISEFYGPKPVGRRPGRTN